MESLSILGELIAAAQSAMAEISDVGLKLAATLGVISLTIALATVIAGGAGGVLGTIVSYIVIVGLVCAAVATWPAIMTASFETADQIASTIGAGGINAIDVIQRGFDVLARIVNNGIQGSVWNPVNTVMYLFTISMGLGLLFWHFILSLSVALSILQFWIGGAVMPIIIPFALVGGLSGVGFGAFAFVIASVVRMIVIAVIVAIGGDVFLDMVIADAGEVLTFGDLGASFVSAGVVAYLAWKAGSWASSIARAAPGGTGVTGMLGMAAGAALGGTGGLAAAAARVAGGGGGGAAGGGAGAAAAARAGAAGGGGGAAGGGGPAGAAFGGTGTVGRRTRP